MGIYLNPGNREFERALNDDIYIDKTELIEYTNSRLGKFSRFLCVSRPRRFGKSMAADMLVSYYSKGCDSDKLFEGFQIRKAASYEEHLNRHNVIRLDIQRFIEKEEDLSTFITAIEHGVLKELKRAFPDCEDLSLNDSLKMALDQIYSQTGESFIFIIDEWDCVFRMAQDDTGTQKRYLDFLRGLFKGAVYAELVYMTGILPIKKYGEHSAVNMFEEHSMTDPKNLGSYFGFTESEVKAECLIRDVDYAEMKRWYDGYFINGEHIYNPKSVIDALRWKRFQSYWTGTETYEALKVYIDRNFDGLKEAVTEMIGGGRCRIDPTTFQNDMTTFTSKDDIMTLLVHLGYLAYDNQKGEVFIPNQEIIQEFIRVVKTGENWSGLMRSLDRSMELLENTWAMDGEAVAAGIDAIHSETSSLFKYNDENSLACTIFIAYYSAGAFYARPIQEMPAGKGRADIIYLPLKNSEYPALVVELKWDQSAIGAIAQIKEKQYTQWLESYTGNILLVGINYDRSTKKHQCVIETLEI